MALAAGALVRNLYNPPEVSKYRYVLVVLVCSKAVDIVVMVRPEGKLVRIFARTMSWSEYCVCLLEGYAEERTVLKSIHVSRARWDERCGWMKAAEETQWCSKKEKAKIRVECKSELRP